MNPTLQSRIGRTHQEKVEIVHDPTLCTCKCGHTHIRVGSSNGVLTGAEWARLFPTVEPHRDPPVTSIKIEQLQGELATAEAARAVEESRYNRTAKAVHDAGAEVRLLRQKRSGMGYMNSVINGSRIDSQIVTAEERLQACEALLTQDDVTYRAARVECNRINKAISDERQAESTRQSQQGLNAERAAKAQAQRDLLLRTRAEIEAPAAN